MNKLLPKLDKGIHSIFSKIVAVLLIILTLIVFVQVLIRYLLDFSGGGLDEVAVFLVTISVWLMAILHVRQDSHIKMDTLPLFIKNEKVLKSVQFFINLLSLAAVVIFTYLSFEYVGFGIETGDTTPGLELPVWWFATVLPLAGILMTVYYIVHLVKYIKEVRSSKTWK